MQICLLAMYQVTAAERETKVKGENMISNYSGDDLFGCICYVKTIQKYSMNISCITYLNKEFEYSI